MRRLLCHLSVGLLAATTTTVSGVAQAPQMGDTATFSIIVRGARVGSETVTVSKSGSGWLISATGRQAPPVDLITTKFEMAYGADWQPQRLVIEGLLRGQQITLTTTFGLTTAMTDMMQAGQKASTTHQLTPRAIVLPPNFFGAYEAVASRLGPAPVGSRFPVFVAPQGEISVMVDRISSRRLVTPDGPLDLRQFDVTFSDPAGPLPAEIWIDSRNRLVRVAIPAAATAFVRDDVSTVMTREEPIRHAGDEDLYIPAAGFNLAATVTRPATTGNLPPAVVLVSGAGPENRDELRYGIPMFGQLAGTLASAGVFVVRYDKRGIGQSGGRPESAALIDYADDVVGIVRWLKRRKDIDSSRIVIVGHGEGAAVALIAADRESGIRAVGLVAAGGTTGREVTLEQQQNELARLKDSDADRKAKIALQQRVIEAAIKGSGWETVPAEVRRRADTPWFRSVLLFDPAVAMKKIDQPVLVVHGSLDREILPVHADRLEVLSRARKRPDLYTRKVVVAGVNHLLVPADTGEIDEYPTLGGKTVSPEISAAIVAWLNEVAPAKR